MEAIMLQIVSFQGFIFYVVLQVTEETANLLTEAGYELECRGPTFVKGKGTLTTYFVRTPFDTKSEISKWTNVV